MIVFKFLREWLEDFKADWRNQTWTLVQWAALITILFSPVWSEHFGSQDDLRNGGRRDLASSIEASVDPAISSTILRIPSSVEENVHRVFVNSPQVRFEWRRTLEHDREVASVGEELVPVSMSRLSRERTDHPEDISLIASDAGEVVVSTYVELEDGVNTFQIHYQGSPDRKVADLTREFLVVFKKSK